MICLTRHFFGALVLLLLSGTCALGQSLGIRYVPLNQEFADKVHLKPQNAALVAEVSSGSPAQRAGIVPGDLIAQVNGQEVQPTETGLASQIRALDRTVPVDLLVLRGTDQLHVKVDFNEGFGATLDAPRPTSNLVGKTYWAYLNRPDCVRAIGPKITSTPDFLDSKYFYSANPFKVLVQDVVSAKRGQRYLKLLVNDSTTGYSDLVSGHFTPIDSPLLRTVEELKTGCIFDLAPQELTALIESKESARAKKEADEKKQLADWIADQKRIDAAETARREKLSHLPGARIGMTPKEVREKTNWGDPDHINRTVTSGGIEEQWVYGGGNYLYFRNGHLSAIQN